MVSVAWQDLFHGFELALQPGNLLWCFIGVTIGNLVGVLPGMGVLSAVSILLPLTFGMQPLAAILMIAGIFYGAQYGGAICSILLNLPCHPPHAVTCLDGYAMTRQGKGALALGISIMGALFGAAFGILQMTFLAPVIASLAYSFGPTEICALMLLGLVSGATLSRGSALRGLMMTILGLVLGLVGTDVNTGVERMTLGFVNLDDGIGLVSLALGLFGVAEFLRNVNALEPVRLDRAAVRLRDMLPGKADMREAMPAVLRGTLVGSLCSLVPGTGPTISSILAYALEKKVARDPSRFGRGAIAGVAAPETSTHSSVQGDFIPTMTLGIPGDAAMALLLGALVIHGIQPGPRLLVDHADIFWSLIASFWIGNLMLVVLNVPMIGLWVRLLAIPYKYLYPTAIFFICIGVFAENNSTFDVITTLIFGIVGYGITKLGFHPAPILLGFVLGPRFEENFRRALLISHGDLGTFVDHPISAAILAVTATIVAAKIAFAWSPRSRAAAGLPSSAE